MKRLRLKGDAKERGHIHGESFRSDIKELVEIRRGLIASQLPEYKEKDFELLSRQQVQLLACWPELEEEFIGICEASNCSTTDITILNNYTDMKDFPHDEGCSIWVIRDDKNYICGQTWDMHASAKPYTLLLELEENASKSWVLSLTGCLGMAGMSTHPLAVFINNLRSDETAIGMMWPALVRRILLEESRAKAKSILERYKPSSGRSFMFCDENGFVNLECTGKRIEMLQEEKYGVCYHTNHYLGKLRSTEKPLLPSSTSKKRLEDLEAYFSKKQEWSYDIILSDILEAKGVDSVSIKTPQNLNNPMTCGGIMIDMLQQKGVVFSGNYNDRDHIELNWS